MATCLGVGVVAADQDVLVVQVRPRPSQVARRHVVEGADHARVGRDPLRPSRRPSPRRRRSPGRGDPACRSRAGSRSEITVLPASGERWRPARRGRRTAPPAARRPPRRSASAFAAPRDTVAVGDDRSPRSAARRSASSAGAASRAPPCGRAWPTGSPVPCPAARSRRSPRFCTCSSQRRSPRVSPTGHRAIVTVLLSRWAARSDPTG